MDATNYEKERILNHIFGGYTASYVYTPQEDWYLGLSTTTISSSGSTVTEPSASNGYSRVAVPNTKVSWTEATAGSLVTAAAFAFPQSSTSAWGTIRSIFLSTGSDPASGSVCYYYTADPSFPVTVNTVITFSSGSISVTM